MLRGKNIILRPLRKDDITKTNIWRNDLELIRMTQGYRLPKTLEMDEDWFNRVLGDTTSGNAYFGIDVIENSEFIGLIQLNNIDYISRTAVWGIIIGDPNNRGKGYSVEASFLLFDYAFNTLNLRKILGYVIEGNKASLRMHERIGFNIEGCLRDHVYYDSKYHNVLVMSVFRKDEASQDVKI